MRINYLLPDKSPWLPWPLIHMEVKGKDQAVDNRQDDK